MPHPLEARIRDAYAAFGRGYLDGYLSACTEDFIFNVPGGSAIGGTYRGKEGLYDIARKAMEFTAGSFEEDVEDVRAIDHHAVVLARHRFTRSGQPKRLPDRARLPDSRRQAGRMLGGSTGPGRFR